MRAVKRLSAVLMVVVFVLQGMATAADFSPEIGSKLSTRKVKKKAILKNPRKAGRYVFSSKFTSLDSGAVVTIKQPIKITR
jgi:hypothetical protein